MLSVILLAWTISNCCPAVTSYRSAGYTDKQIEELARSSGVPEWIILYAKKHCITR